MNKFKSFFERAGIRYDIKKREMHDRAFAKNEFLRGAQGVSGSHFSFAQTFHVN